MVTPQPRATISASALRGWLEERLAAYKIPRIYQFVDELPKGPTGKIMKRAIDRSETATEGERPSRVSTSTP